ncbi:UNVERIFIED_CONTAM: hypothetical protein PYX00_008146 [Menopon gallinae]|uniref:Uncharacterized protein n=1 Tax=Menopon gallinae TaxID=328185 RepID=A0AAW2HLR8_9NEOP
MQEPSRLNLLNLLQKNLKTRERKTYIHRTIYIGDYSFNTPQDCRLIQLIFESNIKLLNDECDIPLTGFGLFYDGYFINIIERSFITWLGRPASPPVLLEKIEATGDPADTLRQIHTCIRKLYKLMDYLSSQPGNVIRATLDNISEVCQQHLPEANLLDFLLSSPALLDVSEFLSSYGTAPEVQFMEELVWPIPTDFVPYNIVGRDKSKVLMIRMNSDGKEYDKKDQKEDDAQGQDDDEAGR